MIVDLCPDKYAANTGFGSLYRNTGRFRPSSKRSKNIFFRRRWANWLRDSIPGATDVVEIDGACLFFPNERATELTAALRRHWDTHP